LSINNLAFFDFGPVVHDQFFGLGVLGVELVDEVILGLGMVDDFLGLFKASPHEDTLNIQIGFITIDTEGSETILAEMFQALKEAIRHVTGHVDLLAFAFELVIFEMPEGKSI
jgi:hypothetical protein